MSGRGGRPRPRAPRKPLGQNDAVDARQCWEELETSLQQILTRDHSDLSFEHLFRNSYRLVLKKKGDLLYDNFKALETRWLLENVHPGIMEHVEATIVGLALQTTSGSTADQKRFAHEQLMRALKTAWLNHTLCMGMTTDVLMYMDRVYCAEQRKVGIYPLTMGLFRDHILHAPISPVLHAKIPDPKPETITVLNVLIIVTLAQIELERGGDIIDRGLVRSCLYMLEELNERDDENETSQLYLTRFEPEYLQTSRAYYKEEAQRLLKSIDAGSFCRHTQRRLIEEERRCGLTIPQATHDRIIKVVEEELIKNTIKEVISMPGSGVGFMLDNDRVDELRGVYELILRVDPHKKALQHAVQQRIIDLGSAINTAARATAKQLPAKPDGEAKAVERPVNQQTVAAIEWVSNVLALKDRYDSLLSQAFYNDKGLETAFTESFKIFINSFDRCSEYLSLFFDDNMKKGIKGKTESEIDALVEKGIILLRYVQDKDLFEVYYKKHLARRLILKKSASMESERHVLVKMKMEIGDSLTARIEPMFKDIDVSNDFTAGFKKYQKELGDADKKGSELEIHVLTNTMWPLEGLSSGQNSKASRCIWPNVLDRIRTSFERFYLNKHSGRKLTWPAQLGTVDIRATFPLAKSTIKTRELNCSTYAAIILLLFNDVPDGEALTYTEIQARTGIDDSDLMRNLQSLAVAPKTRILLKEPMSRDVKADDKFSFNAGFSSNFQKIKIGVVAANKAENTTERQETEKKNDESRGLMIEAAIVRVMKQRKHLSHLELTTEVSQQLMSRFSPDLVMIKKRIESLIEREYLERLEDNEKPAYKYLA